jgi:uncharacterized protein (DUF924 family)
LKAETEIQADILEFWFSERIRPYWFKSQPHIDAEIRDRYAAQLEMAAARALHSWCDTAHGCLALVLVLDQFSRNIFRGTSAAYDNDEYAREVARLAINTGSDRKLEGWHKAFLYMPFMHSEFAADQDYSVQLFTQAELDNARYALHHRDIIRRFGRFPHRNAILNRPNTAAESEYLAAEDAFKG